MEKNAKIYVAGHRGMVGSAIVRELQRQGYTNIITRTHKELDLTRQVGHEDGRAAQDRDEDDAVGVVLVVLRDARADLGDALFDFILGEQDSIDVFVHDDYLFDAFRLKSALDALI